VTMFSVTRVIVALIVSGILSGGGYRKRSLDKSGTISGFFVGLVHCLAGWPFVIALGLFFVTSSWLTKYKGGIKKNIEHGYKEGGGRNWLQVFANGGVGTFISIVYLYTVGTEKEHCINFDSYYWPSMLLAAFVGHYACVNGDTWSSEVGVLSKGDPYLITSWKKVKKGTNGGVSFLGTVASILGGSVIGLGTFISFFFFSATPFSLSYWRVIFFGSFAGLLGSLIDSILGATLQYSGWDPQIQKVVSLPTERTQHISGLNLLDNHQVNFLSSILTSAIAAYISPMAFRPL